MNEPMQAEVVEPSYINNSQVELDLKIGISDITDMLVVQHEDGLTMARDQIEANLNQAKRKHGELSEALQEAGQKLLKKYTVDEASKKLCLALKAFHGKAYKAVLEEGTVDVENEVVTATLLIVDSKQYQPPKADERRHYRSYSGLTDKKITIKFTAAMKKQIKAIADQAKVVTGIQEELTEIRKKLADLPRLVRRAKGEIVKAQLQGELNSPQKILQAVVGLEPKALPNPNA